MVVPTKKKFNSPKVKSKVRYYTGVLLIVISALNFFFESYSPVASVIIWPLGLFMMMSAIRWPTK